MVTIEPLRIQKDFAVSIKGDFLVVDAPEDRDTVRIRSLIDPVFDIWVHPKMLTIVGVVVGP